MTQEELFRYGYSQYKDAMRHIDALNVFISQTNANYSASEAKHDFDIIIQGLMLKVAIADGDATREEIDYIKSIVDSGDILRFMRDGTNGKLDISWHNLIRLDESTFKKLLDVIDEPLKALIKKFSLPYVVLEVVLGKDYFDTFKDALLGVLAPLCMVDGDSDNVGEKFSVVFAMQMFEGCWNEVKELADNEQRKKNPATSAPENTLKSRFEHLKKN